jgi:hypothetical protein
MITLDEVVGFLWRLLSSCHFGTVFGQFCRHVTGDHKLMGDSVLGE